jgi:ATP/maltotriose-dependent transcriptional regulator MalT
MAAIGMRIAQEAGDVDLQMLGLAVQGLALVTAGSVGDGMRRLDEVNTAVIAGEMTDLVAIGLSCCYLIAACERVRDYDRALQWCTRLKAFCAKWGFRPLFAVCRTQYASLCVWRGTWEEAEEELRAASDELAASRPAMTGDALVRLAELRRRQGRLAEAATLLDQVEPRGLALLGWAEIAFDRGDLQTAAEQSARYLRHVPAHNRTDRAAGLDVLVRALTDLGEWERARASLAELSGIAERLGTTPLRALDSFVRGYAAVREGHADAARQHFEDAVDGFLRSGAPFEVARSRLELAGALHRIGRTDAAIDEAKLATKIFTELKAERESARAREVLTAITAASTSAREKTAVAQASLLTRREVEVLRLVAEGLSNQTIATRLFVSDHTVHRHVANILNKLSVSTRAAAVAQAARRGLLA